VRDTGYSRIPVFRDSINEIEGFVMLVDLLEEVAFNDPNGLLEPFIREPLVVEADIKADQLLALFRDLHVHLAVVQKDDHTIGIISLEDVLEELVGDIKDEIDAEELQ
jgi:putative hemolysin